MCDRAIPARTLANTSRRPVSPHPKRCSIAGSISSSRKSSQGPIDAELIYWLPPTIAYPMFSYEINKALLREHRLKVASDAMVSGKIEIDGTDRVSEFPRNLPLKKGTECQIRSTR